MRAGALADVRPADWRGLRDRTFRLDEGGQVGGLDHAVGQLRKDLLGALRDVAVPGEGEHERAELLGKAAARNVDANGLDRHLGRRQCAVGVGHAHILNQRRRPTSRTRRRAPSHKSDPRACPTAQRSHAPCGRRPYKEGRVVAAGQQALTEQVEKVDHAWGRVRTSDNPWPVS